MNYKSIPCAHETDGVSVDVVLDDYYPLSDSEIDALLSESLISPNASEQQVRLNQCLRGFTCPRTTKGEVAKKERRLNTLFMDGYRSKEWNSEQKEEIYLLCGNKES